MVSKEDTLSTLRGLSGLEERIIGQWSIEFMESLATANLPVGVQSKLLKLADTMVRESKGHEKSIMALADKIEAEGKDDY